MQGWCYRNLILRVIHFLGADLIPLVQKRGCAEICPDGMTDAVQLQTNEILTFSRCPCFWKGNPLHPGKYSAIAR
jgi:hypothetical protein